MEKTMTKQDVIQFANENPASFLATSENHQPHVRGFLLWFADETGFYYHTGSTKRVYDQLTNNPKAEACFTKMVSQTEMTMMRVQGDVEFIQDEELKKRLLSERPWLNMELAKSSTIQLIIFKLVNCQAHFWDMASNLKEREAEVIKF